MTAHDRSQHVEPTTIIGPFAAALAATIIRSKPSNVSLQDYIHRVHHALNSGHARTSIDNAQINGLYQCQMQQQLSDRDDQIKKLVEENTFLKAALAVPTDAVLLRSSSDEHHQSWSEALHAARKEQEAKTQELLRYLSLAQRLISGASPCDAMQLSRCLHQIVVTVTQLSRQCNAVRHQCIFSASARAMMLVYQGIPHLASDEDPSNQSKVIFAAVQLYNDLLGGYDCVSESMRAQDPGFDSIHGQENATDDTTYLTTLTAFLIYLIDKLDAMQDAHRKLYEGYVFVLTAMTGRHLYPAVFGCAREPTLEAEIRASERGSEDNLHENTTADVPLRLSYLVKLLKHTVSKSAVFLVGSESSHTTSLIRTRLQHTLVEAIFGQDESSGRSTRTLQLPAVHVGVEDSVAQPQDMTTTEWFIQEVWSIVGWDVIAQ